MILPHAREDDLVVRELEEETLVYDLERDRAHCLNRTAALVWRRCDGRTSLEEMAAILEKELNVPAPEEAVLLALQRLERAHLLREGVRLLALERGYTRRQLLMKMGMVGAAAVLAPTVLSLVAPRAAHALSCTASNACGMAADCTPCGPPQCTKRCCAGKCQAITKQDCVNAGCT